jgi:hypothetical protein
MSPPEEASRRLRGYVLESVWSEAREQPLCGRAWKSGTLRCYQCKRMYGQERDRKTSNQAASQLTEQHWAAPWILIRREEDERASTQWVERQWTAEAVRANAVQTADRNP